jgi:Domain of unknown function (DUF305)
MSLQPQDATRRFLLALMIGSVLIAEDRDSSAGVEAEAPYLAETGRAMKKMMDEMAVKPTGDVDRDFVAMMVPHHQGAIEMAIAVLRHGRNERIRRLAQEIVITQQQEIVAMRLAIGEAATPSIPPRISPSPVSARELRPSPTPN